MPDSYELHLRQIERAKMEERKTKLSDQSVFHTPGPWRAGRADKSYDAGIPDNVFAVFAEPQYKQKVFGLRGNAAVICVITKPERMTEEDIANAKLIAAVPDLLDACELFVGAESHSEINLAFNAAKAAIEKATR